jgi:bifunctional non-homologous end joining protein LigD
MHPRPGERADKPNWLLIKEHDEYERPKDAPSIEKEAPNSVLSGRDLDAIARHSDRVWQSNCAQGNGAAAAPPAPARKSAVKAGKPQDWTRRLRGAPKEKLPEFIEPQLATLARSAPSGQEWLHEIKLDGYRIQARVDGRKTRVQLLTRNALDWTHRMKSLADAVRALPFESALIDGEVVVLQENGVSSFAELQNAFQENAKRPLAYFAFDLLHLDGHNLRNLPLIERKQILKRILRAGGAGETIRLSEDIAGGGAAIFRKACELGTEGIVSKRADSKYSPGRGGSWQKIKCYREQELVIGGFTLPAKGIHGVGALLLGYYRGGKLVYAGKTGTGFTQTTHRTMRDRLDKIRIARRPFAAMPAGAGKAGIWVKPELVAQVNFSNWTADNLVRQASFKGLREDKPARSVVREMVAADPNPNARQASKRSATASSTKRSTPARKIVPAARRGKSSHPEELPIPLTHPDKVLDTETGVTKEQLARYYWELAPYMLPHIEDRPLTLVRCTQGSGKPCFYQKHRNQMLKGLDSVDVVNRKTGAHEPYITLSTPEALVELAQIGVLEVHPWGSRNEKLEQPDRIVFDLDPDPAIDWQTVASSAKEVRKRLNALGLKSFVKTTGGKGLHVVVPIRPEHEWPAVKQFAHDFVSAMERDAPKLFLTKMTKSARKGKIYLDYLRNDRGATSVAPFSPRARSGLPVAIPLNWNELNGEERPQFRVSDIQLWRKRLKLDPWKEMLRIDQRLPLS